VKISQKVLGGYFFDSHYVSPNLHVNSEALCCVMEWHFINAFAVESF